MQYLVHGILQLNKIVQHSIWIGYFIYIVICIAINLGFQNGYQMCNDQRLTKQCLWDPQIGLVIFCPVITLHFREIYFTFTFFYFSVKETAVASRKSAETKDIERIIRNRMKSLNIEGECKLTIFIQQGASGSQVKKCINSQRLYLFGVSLSKIIRSTQQLKN